MAHQQEQEGAGSDLKIGLMALGGGLVWILIVAVIAYRMVAH